MMVVPKKISYFILFVLCFSCANPIDVDQLDDASFDTSYIFTLIHLDLEASNFLDDFNQEIAVTTDAIQIPSMDDLYPHLTRVEFTVKTTNSFNRNFTLNIHLFDENKELIYTLQPVITVPSNSSELTHALTIPENDINILYSTGYIGINMSLWDSASGETINITDTSEFVLKSSMELFFNFKKA